AVDIALVALYECSANLVRRTIRSFNHDSHLQHKLSSVTLVAAQPRCELRGKQNRLNNRLIHARAGRQYNYGTAYRAVI
ncbi:MAG: hypothetical protein ACXWXZ_15190, partial [Candidatus Binatia bacterium]